MAHGHTPCPCQGEPTHIVFPGSSRGYFLSLWLINCASARPTGCRGSNATHLSGHRFKARAIAPLAQGSTSELQCTTPKGVAYEFRTPVSTSTSALTEQQASTGTAQAWKREKHTRPLSPGNLYTCLSLTERSWMSLLNDSFARCRSCMRSHTRQTI